MSGAPVHGMVEPGFDAVYDVFERSFQNGELGASVCAYVDGSRVVDLWGGWADADRTREWQRDTIACIFSATKGMTATCAHQLMDRGQLDVDERVATYWPEFAQAGKEDITVRMVLSHQAGLPWTTVPYPEEKRWDWNTRTDALARSTPVWKPGTRSEYHGGTFGHLIGNIVHRIDGRSLDTYFREEIAEPLGADAMITVGPDQDHRCAELVGPRDEVELTDSRQWRAAGDGAATGHAAAVGLARMYAALACGGELDGVRVLRSGTIQAAVQEQPLPAAVGIGEEPIGLGYQLLWKILPDLASPTFGHFGTGGAIGLADPTTRLGFGYVMNQMFSGGRAALLKAIYASLRT